MWGQKVRQESSILFISVIHYLLIFFVLKVMGCTADGSRLSKLGWRH
jgi:hypothetical protein